MRRRWTLLPALLLVIVIISAFLVLRARGGQETGQAFALCPGPDEYGYRCEPGAAFTYIDAVEDTFLYDDDGVVVVDLPFPFIFYGQSYQEAALGSNGTIQFTTENAAFNNECLNQGPVEGMGELIAPYWDDLDLTLVGFLETAVVGNPGSRIFVIEWDDIPPFGSPDERVTFEVQLFEANSDIVFLYQDVNRSQGSSGRSATIGLQSEILGNSLQFGCNQLSLTNGLNIRFPHPADAAQEMSRPPLPLAGGQPTTTFPKGDLSILVERLNQEGINALQNLEAYWLAQQPPKEMQALPADVNGDGVDELVLFLRPPAAFAQQSQLVVAGQTETAEGQSWQVLYHSFPLARQPENGRQLTLDGAADKTADGILDILLRDLPTGELFVLTAAANPGSSPLTASGSQNPAESITFELISPLVP